MTDVSANARTEKLPEVKNLNVDYRASSHPRYPFVIGTCKEVLPVLRSVQGEDADQIVACHLYDPRFHVEPPSMADLARNYEALAEESNAQ